MKAISVTIVSTNREYHARTGVRSWAALDAPPAASGERVVEWIML